MATTYNFTLVKGTSVAFNAAAGDVLAIVAHSARQTTLTQSGANVIVTTPEGSVTLLATTVGQLALAGFGAPAGTITSVSFADGSLLAIGDMTSNDALDAVGNTIGLGANNLNNLVYGFGGGDTITVGNGNNLIFGGTGAGDSTDGNDLITVGTGSNTIHANGGNDTIAFSGPPLAGNTVTALLGTGNDIFGNPGASAANFNLTGGTGNDTFTLTTTTGDVTIWGYNEAPDTASADGAETIILGTGNARVFTAAGNDTVTGNAVAGKTATVGLGHGNDTFTWGAGGGVYTVFGGTGADLINSGSATLGDGSVLYGSNFADPADGNDTINGGGGTVSIFGNGGNDVITAAPAAAKTATVHAGQGDDTITGTGAAGAFLNLAGGLGDDRFNVSLVAGGATTTTAISDFNNGNDVVALTTSAANTAALLTVARSGTSVAVQGTGLEALAFSNFTGQFTATNFSVDGGGVLLSNWGGAATTLTGVAATGDQLIAGDAGDTLRSVSTAVVGGTDRFVGGNGNDTFVFDGAAADFDSTDTVIGGAGTNSVTFLQTGTAAQVVVDADFTNVSGVQKVVAANTTGANSFTLGALAQAAGVVEFDASGLTGANVSTLVGGAFTVALTATGGNGVDTFTTGSGNDVVSGAGGADVLVAGAGLDTVSGGDNNDAITGGTGADDLTGGAGADTFTWLIGDGVSTNVATAIDIVQDFNVAQGDILNLSGIAGILEAEIDAAGNTINSLGAIAGATLADALTNATVTAALSVAGRIITFTNGGFTYLVVEDGAGLNAFNAGADFIVKLGASTDLAGFGDANILGA